MTGHRTSKCRNTLAHGIHLPAGTWKTENHQVEMALAYSSQPLMVRPCPKEIHTKCKMYASPRHLQGKNAINYTSNFGVSLTSEHSAHEHTVTIVNVHYFAKNGIAEDNKLLQYVGKIWRNQKSDTWQTNVAGLVTVIRHRGTSGEWKNVCYTRGWLYKYINHHTEELKVF